MIPAYKKILYATDLSENAAQAFRHAISIARNFDGEIHIIYVVPQMDSAVVNYVATVMGADKLAELSIERDDEAAAEIHKRVHNFALEELADHPEDEERIASVKIAHGHPASQIINGAEETKADLIVMASHGKGALRQVFLGSVAEKVLRKAPCPVLVSRLID